MNREGSFKGFEIEFEIWMNADWPEEYFNMAITFAKLVLWY